MKKLLILILVVGCCMCMLTVSVSGAAATRSKYWVLTTSGNWGISTSFVFMRIGPPSAAEIPNRASELFSSVFLGLLKEGNTEPDGTGNFRIVGDAALLIAKVGSKQVDIAVAALLDVVREKAENPDRNLLREVAIVVLGWYGSASKAAVPMLIDAIVENNVGRMGATAALGWIGPDAIAAVPALVLCLKDEEPFVRENAARALGDIGPEAKNAVTALTDALADEKKVRKAAKEALEKIQSAE